ncbi:ATP-binding cassette domain-containing protein [Pseudomonas sp. Irchel 3A5]|uniref:ABC transporter ATP-binding protein n=1 Tax=Pseudomonas sp. Irchel 3A5 TaxID=2008911 RepID=UPI000BA4BCFF|nr:ATP-binding cassette domain-containing protein [Pseudomonas sp. Irchel 3A5]
MDQNSAAYLLYPVNFTLSGGDRVAITGSSGSGKSVFLRTLALLDAPGSGQVVWHDQPVQAAQIPGYRSKVCYIAQRPSMMEGTVEDNLRFPYSLNIFKQQKFDIEKVKDLLRQVGKPENFLLKTADDLSGGEAQVVSLIRAIQLDPEVMLLDEPTAALDPQSSSHVEKLVNTWFNGGAASTRAYIWVSHDLDQAQRMSNIRLEMHAGVLTAMGNT